MNTLVDFLPTLQVVFAVLLIIGILMQQGEESLGGSFGGSDSFDTVTRTRRGAEKVLFQSTIAIAIAFIATSVALILI